MRLPRWMRGGMRAAASISAPPCGTTVPALAAVVMVLLVVPPAFAFCSEPIIPLCADDGVLSDDRVSARECKSLVRDYLEDLTIYRNCLQGRVQQTTEEIHRLRQLIEPGAES